MPDLRTDLNELRQRLNELEQSSRANFGQLAQGLRRTRQHVLANELAHSVKRLTPPVGLVDWTPRQGEPANPAIADSLIDRLRKGSPVADSFGNADSVIGMTNLLANPEMTDLLTTPLVVFPGAAAGEGWKTELAHYSGASANYRVQTTIPRGDWQNPFNTALVTIGTDGAPSAAAREDELVLWQFPQVGFPALPWLVAACRVLHYGQTTPAHWTTAELTVQIYNTSTATIIAESDPINLHDWDGQYVTRQIATAAFEADPTDWISAIRVFRIVLHLVSDGSGTGEVSITVGEPQFHFAYSPDPVPFAPLLGQWVPNRLYGYTPGGGYSAVGLDAADGLTFGPGTFTQDVRLDRAAAGLLELSTNGVNYDLELWLTGYTAKRARITLRAGADTQPRVRIYGDATAQSLEFGPGNATPDVRLARTAASAVSLNTAGSGPGKLLIGDTDAGSDLSTTQLTIGTERAWYFHQLSTGANARLALTPLTGGGKTFEVTDSTDAAVFQVDALDTNPVIYSKAPVSLDVGRLRLNSLLVPATITANQHDYTPSGISNANVVKLTTDGTVRTITGLYPGADGDVVVLTNVNSATAITFAHDSASSTAGYKFLLPNNSNYTLNPRASLVLWYDTVSNYWRVLSAT